MYEDFDDWKFISLITLSQQRIFNEVLKKRNSFVVFDSFYARVSQDKA